jgi:endonuclease/exonuclease/phosphatase family metal-dependent hydrolase
MPTLVQVLKHRAPDIICMQEVGNEMYKDIKSQLPLYGSTFGIKTGTSFGCATFFKKDVLRVLQNTESRNVLDKNSQHKKERVVAHVTKLQYIASKKSFVVCNTHLLYGFNTYMDQMRKEVVQKISGIMLSREYRKLPQLLCGDFNSKAASIPLQEITNSGYFFDVYHSVTRTDPEVTVEAFQHGEPIAVDYVFATKEFTPLNVLQMPTVKSMRRTPLPIPGFEPSDHMYHLAELVI